MPQQPTNPYTNANSFTIQDDDLNRTFVIPMPLSKFSAFTPVVQNRIMNYYVNTILQDEQVYRKGKAPDYGSVPPTPQLKSGGFQFEPIGSQPKAPTSDMSGISDFMTGLVTPPLKNLEGAAMGALSPIETLKSIVPNAKTMFEEQDRRADEVGGVEGMGRRLGGAMSAVLGPGPVDAGDRLSKEGLTGGATGNAIGEVLGAMLPFGKVREARNIAKIGKESTPNINIGRGGVNVSSAQRPSFSRAVGDPTQPNLTTNIPRTVVESMEDTKGITSSGKLMQSAIADTAKMQQFNIDRIEGLTARLRQLPTLVEPRAGTVPNPATVQAQTTVGRIPKGQAGAGRMARVSALTPNSYAFLGQPPGVDASANLKSLPRDAIMDIVDDVNKGVIPVPLFKQYFVTMINEIIEDSIPHSTMQIDPQTRRAAQISNIDGAKLMRSLEELSKGEYDVNMTPNLSTYKGVTNTFTPPANVATKASWDRLHVLSHAAGVDANVMANNLGAVASQLEQLQATGKLGPKLDKINLAISTPVIPSQQGSRGRVFGANPMVAGAGAGMGTGAAIGGAVGGLPGAAAGGAVGGLIGTTMPTVIAWAATSPKVMFELRQFLRAGGVIAAEFAAAKRLAQSVRKLQMESIEEAEAEVERQMLKAQGFGRKVN